MMTSSHSSSSSKATLVAILAMMAASTDAAYRMYIPSGRPMSTSLSARMFPPMHRQTFFPRNIGRVMRDFDEIFDSVLGSFDDAFYEPYAVSRQMTRPSYLLQARTQSNALAAKTEKETLEIAQDERQFQIVIEIPGAKASDVNLQLEQDDRILRVFGETNRQNEDISVKSSFQKAFVLKRDIDPSKISAKMEDGVLTIYVPKKVQEREGVRKIDIVEHEKMKEVNLEVVAKVEEEDTEPSDVVELKEEIPDVPVDVKDESVIDLDAQEE